MPPDPTASPLYVETADGAYVIKWSIPENSGAATFVAMRTTGLADTSFRRTFRYEPRPYDASTMERILTPAVAPYI